MNLKKILKAENRSLPIEKCLLPKRHRNRKKSNIELNFFRDGIRTRMVVVTNHRRSFTSTFSPNASCLWLHSTHHHLVRVLNYKTKTRGSTVIRGRFASPKKWEVRLLIWRFSFSTIQYNIITTVNNKKSNNMLVFTFYAGEITLLFHSKKAARNMKEKHVH